MSRTSTTGLIKTVQMTFPAGTFVGIILLDEAVGIGHGTIASGTIASSPTLTYTVTSPVNIPAGTKIRLELKFLYCRRC